MLYYTIMSLFFCQHLFLFSLLFLRPRFSRRQLVYYHLSFSLSFHILLVILIYMHYACPLSFFLPFLHADTHGTVAVFICSHFSHNKFFLGSG